MNGFKKEEVNVEGEKQGDYYFLSPVNAFYKWFIVYQNVGQIKRKD